MSGPQAGAPRTSWAAIASIALVCACHGGPGDGSAAVADGAFDSADAPDGPADGPPGGAGDAPADATVDAAVDAAVDAIADRPDAGGVFEMPASCAPANAPLLEPAACVSARPERLPESVPRRLYVRGDVALALLGDVGRTLVSLEGAEAEIEGIHAVWGCDAEWWAAGDGGVILRTTSAGSEVLPLPEASTVTAGAGCGDGVLVGGDGVWRRNAAGNGWEKWGESVIWNNPDPAERPIHEVIRIVRNGPWTIALANYGEAYLYNPDVGDAWWYHGRTDDLNSDVFIREDGRGFTLHLGYGLYLDANLHFLEEGYVSTPLADTTSVERVSDEAYWLIGRDRVRFVDGPACTEYAVPTGEYDLVAVSGSSLDAERLWLSALLYDPEGGPQTAALLALDAGEGWCVFPSRD